MAQPQLLVTDRKRLQGRMETLAMHGRRVELPSKLPPPEEVAALPKNVRRKQTLSVLAPNAAGKGLRSPPWHLEWLLAPSVKSVPLAFLVKAKKAQWQRWAPPEGSPKPSWSFCDCNCALLPAAHDIAFLQSLYFACKCQ